MSKYLEVNGINVWIEGYTFFVQGNSPFKSRFVLSTGADIAKAIHISGKNWLSERKMQAVVELLKAGQNQKNTQYRIN